MSLAAAALLLGACEGPPLETPVVHAVPTGRVSFRQDKRDKADILFMVDNSASMGAMQAELRNRFAQFFAPFEALARVGKYADLHIGVVTSDYGAGFNSGSCEPSPGGQRGRLQALGAAAPATCKRPVGANFISYKFGADAASATSNLPVGQGLTDTFGCMASVGDRGCGFEHQLESVHAALTANVPENAGFLRDDALLVVVFLTNEDDSSAPTDTDVFDKNKVEQYGYLDSYSRQTRFAIQCCPPGRTSCTDDELVFPPADSGSAGPLAGCRPAPNYPTGAGPGKQFDVTRYIDLFTHTVDAGGVKADPHDIFLVGIDAPEAPFEVLLSNPGTPAGQAYAPCATLSATGNVCEPVLQHSCMNARNPGFFGDPAVRINTTIRAVGADHYALSSICDDDYSPAMDRAAQLVISGFEPGCIAQRLPRSATDPTQLAVDCTVDDVTDLPDGTQAHYAVPRCESSAPAAPGQPCWRIVPKDDCQARSPDGVALEIDRGGEAAPPHTTADLSCAFAE